MPRYLCLSRKEIRQRKGACINAASGHQQVTGWWVLQDYLLCYSIKKKRAVTIATPTSNGSYATSEIQSTFLQRYIDQYSMSWEVLCFKQWFKGENVRSNNQTYLYPQVVILIYNKLFSFLDISFLLITISFLIALPVFFFFPPLPGWMIFD